MNAITAIIKPRNTKRPRYSLAVVACGRLVIALGREALGNYSETPNSYHYVVHFLYMLCIFNAEVSPLLGSCSALRFTPASARRLS